MPGEFTEGPEGNRSPERDEIEEHAEADETEKSAREIVREAVEEAERLEQEEQPLKDVIREIEEIEATEEMAREVLEDTIRELRGLEEDLGYKIDEVREELHDESVNDMESMLEDPSLKETSSESEEVKESRESEEAPASGESYIDGGDGTVSMLETGGAAQGEVNSESEVEEHPETETAETPETKENIAETEEVDASPVGRNSIVKPDVHEDNESDEVDSSTPEKRDVLRRTEAVDELSPVEHESDEPKREYREQDTVLEHEDVEKPVCDESDEITDSVIAEDGHEFPEREQESQEHEVDGLDEEVVALESREREQEITEGTKESIDMSPEVEENNDTLADGQPEVSEDAEATFEDEDRELPDDTPEELVQKIEEMLDELEVLEDEKVDDSRVIVEAMTGKKHIDRSLEPRPYFSETEEDIERRERERGQEKVAELFGKLSAAERKRFKERVRARLKNEDDLDAWLSVHSSLKVSPDFKQNYEDARRYIKTKKVGEVPRLIRELWTLETERHWTKAVSIAVQKKLSKYLKKPIQNRGVAKQESTEIPELVRLIECNTPEDYERLLDRHPYLRDIKDFIRQDRRARTYFEMKRIRQQSPEISDYKLAKILGVGPTTAFNWRKGKRGGKPLIISRLLKNEALRYQYETSLPKESLKCRLDPSEVYCIIREKCSTQALTPRIAALVLMELYSSTEHQVSFAEFRPYNIYGPKNVLQFADYLRANVKWIQQELDDLSKEKGKEKLRVGVAADKFFLRREMPSESLHFEFLRSELFYFDRRVKTKLIRQAMDRLGGIGQFWLSRLIRQLSEIGPLEEIPQHGENNDLRFGNDFLRGETLHFFLQVNEMEVSEIQSKIRWIGERKQIKKPSFLNNAEFLEWLTRIVAIMSSDGSISRDYTAGYFEKNEFRRNYVKSLFLKLGTMNLLDNRDVNKKVKGFDLPAVVGRLLVKCGFPVGDRALQGFRIPDFIMNGPIELLAAYFQEVIPEDGWITYSKSSNRIVVGIGRTSVLYDPQKRKITAEFDGGQLSELIRKYGTKTSRFLGNHENYMTLSMIQLEELANSDEKTVSDLARYLEKLAHESFPQHLSDEQQMLEKLGISPNPYIDSISFSTNTGRISIQYKILTSKSKYIARFGLLAMPKDRVKKAKLVSWMKRNSRIIEEEKVRLGKAGFLNKKKKSPRGSSSV